jgi:hypothetical protein
MLKHFALFVILPILFLKTTVYAQTPAASPERTVWDHNGSVMYLVANGSSREFYYEKPRPGMLEAGVKSGSLLFRGEVNDGQYSGTAYIFNPRCGQVPFQVKGTILDNDERIVLTGQAPRLRRNYQTYASYTSNLEFKLLKSIAASPPPEQRMVPQTARDEEPKTNLPSTARGEINLPSNPSAQLSGANESPLASISTGERKPATPQSSATKGSPKAVESTSTNIGERNPPTTPTTQSSATSESQSSATDTSTNIGEHYPPTTPRPQSSGPKAFPAVADDLHSYVWAAAFLVMFGAVLGFSIGMFWRKRMTR